MDIEVIKSLGIEDEEIAGKLLAEHEKSVTGLRTSQQKILDEKKALAEKYKGVDLEEYTTLKQKLANQGDGDKSLTQRVDALQKMIEERDAAIEAGKKQNLNLHVETEVERAILKYEGIPRALKREVLAMVQGVDNSGKIGLNVVDESGNVRLNAKGGALTLDELLGEMKTSDDWAFGFKSSGLSGGGATNSPSGAAGVKTINRSKFDAMSPAEKLTFVKGGGKVAD